MIQLKTTTVQTIQPGGSVTFEAVGYQSRRGCECFNAQVPNSVKLCANGVYLLSFTGTVTASTAGDQLQLTIAVGGTPLPSTNMDVKPAVVGDLWTMTTTTLYDNSCCDVDRISVVNTGAAPVTLSPNATLSVVRQC